MNRTTVRKNAAIAGFNSVEEYAFDLQRQLAAAHGNTPLRMHIALKILRAWNHGTEGFCSAAVLAVNEWIDGGMKGPVPWPNSPFFAQWAEKNGYSQIDGKYVGFRITVALSVQPEGEGR